MLHLVFKTAAVSSIRTFTCDGTLLSKHYIDAVSYSFEALLSGGQHGSVLATNGDTLFVCSATGRLQAISLGHPAVRPCHINALVSSCNQLASVAILGRQSEVLLVDLSQQQVVHRYSLPGVTCVQEAFQHGFQMG